MYLCTLITALALSYSTTKLYTSQTLICRTQFISFTLKQIFMAIPEVSIEFAADLTVKLLTESVESIKKQDSTWWNSKYPDESVAHTYAKQMIERYNYVRVFGMSNEVPLLSLYVSLNILEKISPWQFLDKPEQWEQLMPKDQKGFGKKEETLSVAETINRHPKCMVLGKPGAGKTTLLKRIAISSFLEQTQSRYSHSLLPVFVTLKDFAETDSPNLLLYIAQQFERCGLNKSDARALSKNLLQKGKCRLLLDGLDEVGGQYLDKTVKHVEAFTEKYPKNHYIITCRTAAYNHQFKRFKDVEVADFDEEQIATFVRNWFKDIPKSADACQAKIKADSSIKELATNPLLLTLLCISFAENFDFPRNRALLYEHAIDALIRKWDSTRQINRGEIYKNLSLPLKYNLLSQMAYKTFVENRYFVQEAYFCDIITPFIQNLAYNDPSQLHPDSKAILRGIDAQHSLITQRAEQIYSFSHLTLQEYFAAKFIVDNDTSDHLAQNYLSKYRWREVFLLCTNLLQSSSKKSDQFFRAMLQNLNNQLTQSPFLINLFTYCQQALLQVENPKYPLPIRRVMAVFIAPALALDLALAQDLALALALARDRFRFRALDRALDLALALDRALDRDLFRDLDRDRALDRALFRALARARARARDLDLDFDKLQLDLGTIKFTEQEIAVLDNYLLGCGRIMACLETEHYISRSLREEIFNSFCAVPPETVHLQYSAEAVSGGIQVFYSYDKEDDEIRAALDTHLAPLKRKGFIRTWHDRLVLAGDEWDTTIRHELKAAQVIVLLISANFLASEKLWDRQITPAIARHKAGEALVLPIIVSPCLWQETVLKDLQPLPRHVTAISTVAAAQRGDVLHHIAQEMKSAIENFAQKKGIRLD